MGQLMLDSFAYRAKVLVDVAKPNLMDAHEAHAEFQALRAFAATAADFCGRPDARPRKASR
jgi:hypothetical protein